MTRRRFERFRLRIVVDPSGLARDDVGSGQRKVAAASFARQWPLFHLVRPPVPARRLWPSELPVVTRVSALLMRLDSFRLVVAVPATVLLFSHQSPGRSAQSSSVTVREGTSMSVTISPDRRTLAIDLQ